MSGFRGDLEPFDPEKHCHDCGRRPIWRHGNDSFCRQCGVKGGSFSEFGEVDLDKLDAMLGPERADEVMRSCGRYS